MRSSSSKTASGRVSHRNSHLTAALRRRATSDPEPRTTHKGRTVKDINVVRGDDRPQALRHQR